MFRSVITFGFLILYITVTAPFILIKRWLLKQRGVDLADTAPIEDVRSWTTIRWLFDTCRILSGARVIYRGLDNLPKDRAVLIAGNHKSYFDIILTYKAFPRPTGYVAKKELKVLSLGVWMREISSIFYDRKDPRSAIEMIKTAISHLNRGVNVCIFPEGTRIKDNNCFGEFPNGSFKPAIKTGAPIVPMSITGTRDLWENNGHRLIPGDVIIEFGEPIDPGTLSKDELKGIGDMVRTRVWELYQKNKTEIDNKKQNR